MDSLFAGGRRGWVRSITSINAPHDGTTIITLWPTGVTDLIASMVKGFAAVAGAALTHQSCRGALFSPSSQAVTSVSGLPRPQPLPTCPVLL